MRTVRPLVNQAGVATRTGGRLAAVLVGALMMLVGAIAAPVGAAPPTTDGPTAAGYGAGWLAGQVDGGLPVQNFGSGDWGATLDTGLALASAQVGATQVDAVWAAIVSNRETVVVAGGADSPGRLAKAIMFAHAIGEDPRAVGTGPGADLVARLEALRQTAGADAGLYGSADATYDGAYRQGASILALQMVSAPVDASSIAWLEAQQCADGSWMPYRSDLGVECAFDGGLFVGPDSNSTAAAWAALAALAPSSASIAPATEWLDDNQNADGGWGFFPGDPSDPNSTGAVITALGSDIGDAEFNDRSATPLATLLSFQLGCTSPEAERGAFTYPDSNDAPNLMATAQAVPAAAGRAPGEVATTVATVLPVVDCSTTTTSTTTSTSTTSTSTTTPSSTTSTTPETSTSAVTPPAGQVADNAQVRSTSNSTSPSASPARLAATGNNDAPLAMAGVALIVVGFASIVMSRRARRA